eukprot:11114754-Heterocapsa_arctica.AAC.1
MASVEQMQAQIEMLTQALAAVQLTPTTTSTTSRSHRRTRPDTGPAEHVPTDPDAEREIA